MDDTHTTLLVAERDEATRAFLLENLAADGYQPIGSQTEQETRHKLASRNVAVLLLGGLDEDAHPLALLRAIRAGEAEVDLCLPVAVLGEGGEEIELLRAFEAGCDHFLARPFSYVELRARIRSCLWRARQGRVPRRLVVGALTIDRDARRVRHAGQDLWLSRLEFDLLTRLAADPTRVFTKSELLRDLWGYRSPGITRTVDAHACRLRRKLAAAGAPYLIHNTRGVGYRLSIGSVPAPTRPPLLAASSNGHAA